VQWFWGRCIRGGARVQKKEKRKSGGFEVVGEEVRTPCKRNK